MSLVGKICQKTVDAVLDIGGCIPVVNLVVGGVEALVSKIALNIINSNITSIKNEQRQFEKTNPEVFNRSKNIIKSLLTDFDKRLKEFGFNDEEIKNIFNDLNIDKDNPWSVLKTKNLTNENFSEASYQKTQEIMLKHYESNQPDFVEMQIYDFLVEFYKLNFYFNIADFRTGLENSIAAPVSLICGHGAVSTNQ